jgi:peptidylprolyl isomerase domain and WD repeat-containing protein 1
MPLIITDWHTGTDEFNRTDFIITTSVDGHLKLWKKQEVGIEFVKHYHAHLSPIVCVSASTDGQVFASLAEDGTCKVFDVVNFGASACLHLASFLGGF